MSNLKFEVVHLAEALEFLTEIDAGANRKIIYNICRAQDKIDPKLFKKLDSVLWEFRTEHKKLQYRLIAFWHKRNDSITLVITTHGFIKKTEKVPAKELAKAHERRRQFLRDEEQT
jgi:phage-related protein